MRVLLFGATGMIGQGVLRECVRDPSVDAILSVVRRSGDQPLPKVTELVVPDLFSLSDQSTALRGYNACFNCAGVSALGLAEAEYTRQTFDLTLAVARAVLAANPNVTFTYVSGQGTDSTERGSAMWARVKGRTENALLQLSQRTYMFRPGMILPQHGIRSRTAWYNAFYVAARPLYPLLERFAKGSVTTTERLGRAMIIVGRDGFARRILETRDINDVSERYTGSTRA